MGGRMGKYIVQKAIEPDDLSAKQAARYRHRAEQWEYGLQPKIDGCHLVILFEDGKHIANLSSTGEIVRSCDHISQPLYDRAPLRPGRVAFLAEVSIPDTDFKDISGAFRRQSAQPQLEAWFFDMVSWSGHISEPVLYSLFPYINRWRSLTATVPPELRCLPLLTGDITQTQAQIVSISWNKAGYGGYRCDGGVHRDLEAAYEPKRCRDAEVVKIKPLLSFDMGVVGVDLAKGEKTGKNTAALIVRFIDGVLLRVATGLTQEEVDDIHINFDANWLGKIIRVDALGHTGTGSLREPRYKGVRTDKVAPDF